MIYIFDFPIGRPNYKQVQKHRMATWALQARLQARVRPDKAEIVTQGNSKRGPNIRFGHHFGYHFAIIFWYFTHLDFSIDLFKAFTCFLMTCHCCFRRIWVPCWGPCCSHFPIVEGSFSDCFLYWFVYLGTDFDDISDPLFGLAFVICCGRLVLWKYAPRVMAGARFMGFYHLRKIMPGCDFPNPFRILVFALVFTQAGASKMGPFWEALGINFVSFGIIFEMFFEGDFRAKARLTTQYQPADLLDHRKGQICCFCQYK